MKNKVQHSTKTGIRKKIKLMETKPTKIKIISEKRPPLKAEILEKCTALQEAYDALDCENKNNMSIKKSLQNQRSTLNKIPKSDTYFDKDFYCEI